MRIKIAVAIALFVGGSVQAQTKEWSLRECIEYALDNNITIKQSELAIEEASIGITESIGGIIPSINASASNAWNSGLRPDPITGTNRNQTFRSSTYGVSGNLTLFDGLRNIRRIQRAKINKILSEYNLGKSKDDIALSISNAYLQVLVNKESLKVTEAQHEITNQQLKRTQDLVEAGSLPQGDLLQIKATAANEKTRIVQGQNAIKLSLISLAQLLLIKDYETFDIAEREYIVPVATILETPVDRILSQARESRYEVQIAEQNQKLAEKDLQIAKGGYYPTLSFGAGVNSSESGAARGITQDPTTGAPITLGPNPFFEQLEDNIGVNYGFTLNIPILNGFSVRSNVKRSKIQIKRMEYQLEQAKLTLDSNVYQAYLDAKGSAEAYEAAQVAVDAQKQAYAYAKDRYDIGMTNAFDFSQSKFNLEDAESRAIQAKFDYIFKLKVLELFFGIKIADIKL